MEPAAVSGLGGSNDDQIALCQPSAADDPDLLPVGLITNVSLCDTVVTRAVKDRG